MHRMLVPILLTALGCYAQFQSAAAPSTSPSNAQPTAAGSKAEISGQVLDAATGQPLKKAWVTARVLEKGGRSGSTAATDTEGRFVLRDLNAGRYTLVAQRNGYVSQPYGQKNAGEQGTTISLSAGQKLTDIIFRLIQGGVISGRIVDEDSEPLSRVQVQALQFRYMQGGQRRLLPVGNAVSDDRGEYRIFGIRPGKVYVRATLRGFGMYAMAGDGVDTSAPSETTSYPPVFYPNVTEATQASALTVRGGDELRADFSMTPQRSYSVSGRVVGGVQGTSGHGVWLTLLKHGDGEFNYGRGPNASSREDNTFTFKQVLPGSYDLIAQQEDEFSESARVEVDVHDSDLQGVVVSLLPKVEVTGHVILDARGSSSKPGSVQISLSSEDTQGFMGNAYAHANDDGSFTLKAAADERYKIGTYGAPPDMYLKSATAGRDDVLEKGFNPASSRNLDLVFAPGAKLTGVVSGADDKPDSGVTVVLAPERPLNGISEGLRTVSTDQNGRYQIQGLRPGSYRVYAFEHVEPGAYEDEEWLKGFADQAHSLKLSESTQETLDLKSIPAGAENAAVN